MGFSMYAGVECEFFLFLPGRERQANHSHPRLGRLLRSDAGRPGRGGPARHRQHARGTGIRDRGGPSRSGSRAARDRPEVRPGSDCWPTIPRPSSSSFAKSPATTDCTPRSCRSRSTGFRGSGMHTHQSLFRGEQNAFFDPVNPLQLSRCARQYIGGLLKHARGFCAITNPLINSYKRLVPDYEAPTRVAWAEHNRSPLVRVPARRGHGTRCEAAHAGPELQSLPGSRRHA